MTFPQGDLGTRPFLSLALPPTSSPPLQAPGQGQSKKAQVWDVFQRSSRLHLRSVTGPHRLQGMLGNVVWLAQEEEEMGVANSQPIPPTHTEAPRKCLYKAVNILQQMELVGSPLVRPSFKGLWAQRQSHCSAPWAMQPGRAPGPPSAH